MALYHDPKTGTTVEAKNSKEAIKAKTEAKTSKPKDTKPKSTAKAKTTKSVNTNKEG